MVMHGAWSSEASSADPLPFCQTILLIISHPLTGARPSLTHSLSLSEVDLAWLITPTLTDTHVCTLLKGDFDLGNRVEV